MEVRKFIHLYFFKEWLLYTLLASISGVLCHFSSPLYYGYVSLICLVPLFYTWWSSSFKIKVLFYTSLLCGGFLSILTCNWIFSSAHNFGITKPAAFLLFLAYIFENAIYFFLIGLLARGLRKLFKDIDSKYLNAFNILFSWYFVEIFFYKVFPWTFSHSLMGHSLINRLAPMVGFTSLSILVIMTNLFFLVLLQKRQYVQSILAASLVMGLLHISKNLLKLDLDRGANEEILKLALVQPSLSPMDPSIYPDGHLIQYDQAPLANLFLEYIEKAVGSHPDVDIIIFPETAMPAPIDNVDSDIQFVSRSITSTLQNSILLGATTTLGDGFGNSALLYNAGNYPQIYNKSKLFPFGEYIPFSNQLPSLRKFFPLTGGVNRGDNINVLKYKSVGLGVSICFESLFSSHQGQLVRSGADILVNIANDKRFNSAIEANLHSRLAQAKALEQARPLIRVGNNGPSFAMNSRGKIINQLNFNKKGVLSVSLPYQKQKTISFFENHKNSIKYLALIILFIPLAINLVQSQITYFSIFGYFRQNRKPTP